MALGPGVHPRSVALALLHAGRVRPAGPEAEVLEQPREHHQAGQADDDVDHIGDRPGPDDLRDEVPLEQAHEQPVEGTDHDEREPHGLHALDDVHRYLLLSDGLCETSRCTLARTGCYTKQSSRTRSCDPGVHALAETSRRSTFTLPRSRPSSCPRRAASENVPESSSTA